MKNLYLLFTVLVSLVFVLLQVQVIAAEHELPLMDLVKEPRLQKDLKLSDAEFRKFQDFFKDLEKLIVEIDNGAEKLVAEMAADIPEQNSQNVPTKVLEAIEKYFDSNADLIRKETQIVREKLRKTLSEEQYEKFSTRVVQVYIGQPEGYMFVDLFDALKLTDSQKQKLADHYKKHTIDRIRDEHQNLPAAEIRKKIEESAEQFEQQFMSAVQRKKLDDLIKLMPSYVRLLIFPEELTEYDSLHKPSSAVPYAMRLALKQDFLDGIRREANLSSEESRRFLSVLQKTGKKFQILYYDYQVAVRGGMKQDEALQTWIRGQTGIYAGFVKELQAFLSPDKRRLVQIRMTQLASHDLIMSFVFLCEEFDATNDNRKNAMIYEYKTVKDYLELVTNAKTPQERQAGEKKHGENRTQYMKEFSKDLTTAQQTMFLSKILQGRPDYVNKINDMESGTK